MQIVADADERRTLGEKLADARGAERDAKDDVVCAPVDQSLRRLAEAPVTLYVSGN